MISKHIIQVRITKIEGSPEQSWAYPFVGYLQLDGAFAGGDREPQGRLSALSLFAVTDQPAWRFAINFTQPASISASRPKVVLVPGTSESPVI